MAHDLNVNEFKLKDPVRNIPDGLKEPVTDATPGFFQSLRNPRDLWLEESLPASLYQWMTGNTKKKQAQEALDWIKNNPDQKGSKIYQEAERKLNRFGYLLEEGPLTIDFKEVKNMIKANPRLFGAELVNMVMADPWLLYMPLGWHRLGRGVVNAIRLKYSKHFSVVKDTATLSRRGMLQRAARQDIKVGAIATLGIPLMFSTTWQLGEKAEIDPKRTAIETTIGATAGALLSVVFAGMSGLTSKLSGAPKAVVQSIADKTFKEFDSDPLKAIRFNNEGRYIISDRLLRRLQKETEFLNSAEHFDDTANKIHTMMKPPVENARDMAKNTLLKMATFGGIAATAEFLTEPDEKLLAASKGFAVGAGLYLGAKGLISLFGKTNKHWDDALRAEAGLATPDKMTIRYNSEAQKLANQWKDFVPDAFSRRRVGNYIFGTKVDENLIPNPRAKPIVWEDLTRTEQNFAKEVTSTFDKLGDAYGPEGAQLIFGKRQSYLPLLWEQYPGRDLFRFIDEFDTKVYGGTGKFPFTRRGVFQDINKGIEKGYKLRPGMDDPAELIRIYTFAASKAIAERNLIRHLRRQKISNRLPFIITEPEDAIGLAAKDMSNYTKMDPVHPAFRGNRKGFTPLLHKGVERSIRMVFDAKTENELMASLTTVNFMMKRLAVGFSFFHAGALVESLWFAGGKFDTIKNVIKPRSRAELKQFFDNPNPTLVKDFPHALKILRKAGYDDVIRFSQGSGLKISIPEDMGNDIFYFNIKKVDRNVIEWWKSHLGIKSDANLEKIFRTFDRITWDQVFTKSKLFAFLSALEKEYLFNWVVNGLSLKILIEYYLVIMNGLYIKKQEELLIILMMHLVHRIGLT